ncbi:zeta toxin family protein [Candidatus Saccharibacteria bacterium]|nr:zeta toxin family protein [Candidatus Saccharibacteria bacterium]
MTEAEQLTRIVEYMKAHWASPVKPEWQVSLTEYPAIVKRVVADFSAGKTREHHFVRIAGLSGSGKTTQLLPATEAYFTAMELNPILVAARRFVEYHPHYQEILDFYGEANLRKMTDEFSTIMLFLTLSTLIKSGYDIILDVTLLDPAMEEILMSLLATGKYNTLLLMIATSPEVTEKFLAGRAWRHTRETELEFIRATSLALEYYATHHKDMRIILWSVYDEPPIYDGPVSTALSTFTKYSTITTPATKNDDARRAAKIRYLTEL